jgi:Fur family zinc uptake transcriptional regulator
MFDMARLLRERRPRRSQREIEEIVLARLREHGAPLSAYDVVDRVAAAGDRLVPTQVYRTLTRLVDRGAVYRIEALSAYLVTDKPVACVSICSGCQRVRLFENEGLKADLMRQVSGTDFSAYYAVVEVLGWCAQCQNILSPETTSPPTFPADGES